MGDEMLFDAASNGMQVDRLSASVRSTHAPETNGADKHESRDIIQQAEDEIEMAKIATSPKRIQAQDSSPSMSPLRTTNISPARLNKRASPNVKINTSVSGSAAKVLGLMEDRHRHTVDLMEKILKRQMKFDNDLGSRLEEMGERNAKIGEKVTYLGFLVGVLSFPC